MPVFYYQDIFKRTNNLEKYKSFRDWLPYESLLIYYQKFVILIPGIDSLLQFITGKNLAIIIINYLFNNSIE